MRDTMFDPMPFRSMESPDIEYYPQPNDMCECGHLEKEHHGRMCWGEDCGCREFKLRQDRDEEDFHDKHEPYRPSCPAVVR